MFFQSLLEDPEFVRNLLRYYVRQSPLPQRRVFEFLNYILKSRLNNILLTTVFTSEPLVAANWFYLLHSGSFERLLLYHISRLDVRDELFDRIFFKYKVSAHTLSWKEGVIDELLRDPIKIYDLYMSDHYQGMYLNSL